MNAISRCAVTAQQEKKGAQNVHPQNVERPKYFLWSAWTVMSDDATTFLEKNKSNKTKQNLQKE